MSLGQAGAIPSGEGFPLLPSLLTRALSRRNAFGSLFHFPRLRFVATPLAAASFRLRWG
jgi:hypothetical protein